MTLPKPLRIACAVLLAFALLSGAAAQTYYPDRGDWQRRAPREAGLNAAALDEAVAFAVASETANPRDQALTQAQTFGKREPFAEIIGPMQERGAPSGVIVRRGYVVAEWGDTKRVDMTHSVSKTFLSTVVGIAWQKGVIRDVHERVHDSMPPGVTLFEPEHNRAITWDHLLRQTSDWQGALWGKPDWADRPEGKPDEWASRKLHAPGTRYKYNDVRVNVLALAALHVVRRPLPEVLREEVMEPIDASRAWRWHGYENSWIDLDGRRIQSVSGGGHWGGGMFIDAEDMARLGYLFLRMGRWKERQIVSEKWIQLARTPGAANPQYGYMNWYLNTGRKSLPAAPESSVTFRGAGQNVIYVDWENDLVVVVRWIEGTALNEFISKVLAAVNP